jgi:S1-C subfamily serine protease
MELVELTPGLGAYFGTEQGVLVVRAPRDDTLGLEDGDVILEISGRAPMGVGHALRILASFEPGERLELTIMRAQQRRTLEVDLAADSD